MAPGNLRLAARKWSALAGFLILALAPGVSPGITYVTNPDFLAKVFGEAPEQKMLWLKGPLKGEVTEILGHPYRGLRIRYWQRAGRTAWILDEVGKEKPITIGVVIAGDHIEELRILAFRESRGGEVRFPFFTKQFVGNRLIGDHRLKDPVDGISGATLSVRAVKKVARLALYLNRRVGGASGLASSH